MPDGSQCQSDCIQRNLGGLRLGFGVDLVSGFRVGFVLLKVSDSVRILSVIITNNTLRLFSTVPRFKTANGAQTQSGQ